jgi:uncharacterized protein YcbX
MASATENGVGTVVSLWRYPVKSMMGEELNATWFTNRGLLGDRAFALVDAEDGKVVSAKNPRKWPSMFNFRSEFVEPPEQDAALPATRITLPDGTAVSSQQDDLDDVLSQALGRRVTVEAAVPDKPQLEEYWPDIEDLDHRDTVTDEAIPAGTFFDCAAVHLLTTATVDALSSAYPEGRFEVRRFRPNIVVQPATDVADFVENGWIDHVLAIGDQVRLQITGPCPRCVMTTLAQGDLPPDTGILRTAAKQNQAHVGVYAAVVQGGIVRRGDRLRIVD